MSLSMFSTASDKECYWFSLTWSSTIALGFPGLAYIAGNSNLGPFRLGFAQGLAMWGRVAGVE